MRVKRDRILTDRLEKAGSYFNLHPAFKKAFLFLRQENLAGLAPGRHEIDGDRLYCMISKGPGKKQDAARLEAHRRYIDIQFVIAGTDRMGWRPAAACTIPDQGYDANRDIAFFKDAPLSWTNVAAGSFTIFFPQDAHAPGVSGGEIHKAVIKVAAE